MFLEQMTSQQIDALDRDQTLAVCCISATEQHSLHLPLGTDYFIGSELVRRLELALPSQLLCLPTVWFGASSHHMGFAGTISVPPSTMRAIVHEIARSLHTHRFSKILFLNSHGGNRVLLASAIQEIGEAFPSLQVVGATYWELARDELSAVRESSFGGMGHACELETSIMLAISPAMVDMSKAEPDGIRCESLFSRHEMLSGPLVSTYRTMKQITRHGGYGDPSTASAQKGEQMLDVITPRLVALCADVLEGRL
jgi:creatinine amidohydrolase